MSAVEMIRADASGHLWVADGRLFTNVLGTARERGTWHALEPDPSRWTVFSPDGVPLGSVLTPAGLQVEEIGDDYVLGTTSDELGVLRVQLYDLIKPRR